MYYAKDGEEFMKNTFIRLFKYSVIHLFFLSILVFIIFKLKLNIDINKYINFETKYIHFQNFLSIFITVLTIFVGGIITIATILISSSEKRVFKLIKKFELAKYLISTIKISISAGLLSIIFLSIIYAQLDFNNLIARYILLYLATLLLFIFFNESKVLLILIIDILDKTLNDDTDELIVDIKTNENNNKKTNE